MAKTVTLGGERLGSGNKQKVELHGFGRSTHNLSYIFRTTMAPGTLVPFINEVATPADTWDIDLDSIVKTLPTVGPLFGTYKAQFDVFLCPIRLYNGLMHNNTLNIGRNISQIKLPQIRLTATANNDGTDITVTDINTSQINQSCLLAYLGIRGIGSWDGTGAAPTRDFNATAIIAYWDCVKNYYSNKQEGIAAVIHTPAEALVTTVTNIDIAGNAVPKVPPGTPGAVGMTPGQQINISYTGTVPIPAQILINTQFRGLVPITNIATTFIDSGTQLQATYIGPTLDTATYWTYVNATTVGQGEPAIATFNLTELDRMRNSILTNLSTAPFIINTSNNFAPYKYLYEANNGIPNSLSSQEGLALKCYQSDIFNNWLDTEFIDGTNGVNEATSIDTSGGSFTIDALIIGRKVFNMLNRIVVSDGTLDSWQEVVYDHRPFSKAETPMYQGGLSKEVVFQEVVSNSQTNDQPLGTLAGRGTYAGKHKGGKIVIKVDEPSYILGIVSLTPRIDYSQGNRWDTHLISLDDLHKPDLDEIGFQDSIVEDRAYWDTNWDGTKWVQNSAGKVTAWLDYQTNFNRTYGDFASVTNSMFMTLNRRYEAEIAAGLVQVKDLTTYIDPVKYNYIFAQTNLSAMNFWMQIAVDMTVRRKMSAKIMPNL
jgi:hypothetical protein